MNDVITTAERTLAHCSSSTRPHTPGLERANRRYRIVIAEQKGDRYRLTSAEDGAPTPPNSVSPPRVKTFAAMSLADERRCVIPAAKHGTDPWWGFTGWGWGSERLRQRQL